MESKCHLNNINAKDNLKQIFLYSYLDIQSVFRLIKYNKSLQKKLDIDIKNYYCNDDYKYSKKFEKNGFNIILSVPNIIIKAIMLIFYLIYLILFYEKGSFIDENIKNNCDKNKIEFIEKINNSLIGYFIFLLISIVWYILNTIRTLSFTVITQLTIFTLILLIDAVYYILLCIKYNYSNHIIFDIILKDQNNKLVDCWFMNFDFLIFIFSPIFYIGIVFFICCIYKCNFYNLNDQMIFSINRIKGVDIINFELPLDNRYLSRREINNLLLEYSDNYRYELNNYQIDFIRKINEIRRKYKIPLLKYNIIETIPDYIFNEITELMLYNYKKYFKLNNYSYLFRYKKNEFHNFIEDKEVLNIITNDLLNEIIIIEQYDIENISIFNSSYFKDKQYSHQISYNENEILESTERRF